jgi:hypothetical protein
VIFLRELPRSIKLNALIALGGAIGFVAIYEAVVLVRTYGVVPVLVVLFLLVGSYRIWFKHGSTKTTVARIRSLAAKPPAVGELLLVLFSPKNKVNAVMGDLEERFHEHVITKGKRRAIQLYWMGVLSSIWPLLLAKIRKARVFGERFPSGHR